LAEVAFRYKLDEFEINKAQKAWHDYIRLKDLVLQFTSDTPYAVAGDNFRIVLEEYKEAQYIWAITEIELYKLHIPAEYTIPSYKKTINFVTEEILVIK
jgi:hypothetical protein